MKLVEIHFQRRNHSWPARPLKPPFYEQFEPDVAGELADRCPKMATRSRIRQTGTIPQPRRWALQMRSLRRGRPI